MTLFAVIIGLAGAFAFKTPKHKTARFALTKLGVASSTGLPCSNSSTITIQVINTTDETGKTVGFDYTCTGNTPICTVRSKPGQSLPAPVNGVYTLHHGTYDVECGVFSH